MILYAIEKFITFVVYIHSVKGYLFDTLGVGIAIIILLILFFLIAYSGAMLELLPGSENTLNTTNQTYEEIVYTFQQTQPGMRILFILMYIAIIIASATVDIHPAILVISGILLIFFMIVISVFTDVFAVMLELVNSTNSNIITTNFRTIIDEFPLFSLLTGISMLVVGMFKLHRGV